MRWVLSVIFWLLASAASAQVISDYVSVGPAADWIVAVEAPALDAEFASGRDRVYALTDYQNRYGTREERYTRQVIDLRSAAAVEDLGTVSVDFRPEYSTVSLHHLHIIRDGQTIDALDMSEALMFRTETDRKKLIFSGAMTFSLPVLGLRVGDRLDWAMTVRSRNPAIGDMFNAVRSFGDSVDDLRLHYRIIVDGEEPNLRRYGNPPEPAIIREPGRTTYVWDQPDLENIDFYSDVPPWAWTMDSVAVSNAGSWEDVGALFSADYVITDADRASVAPIVAEIAAGIAAEMPARDDDERARARAALDWVQRNIRYISVDIGASGFTPRRPERVLRRRFGDCKDVTLLLHALLDGLGVASDPILVDTDERGMQFEDQPYPYAFDHIIIAATIDGTLYPMDATRAEQLGTLDTMDRGDLRRGLRLRPGAEAVVELSPSDYPYRKRGVERIDFTVPGDRVPYELEFSEYGEDADATVAWFASSGASRVTRNFSDYLEDIYPDFVLDGDAVLEVDAKAAQTVVTVAGSFARGEDGVDRIENRSFYALNAMPDYEGGTRSRPFALGWPAKVEHVREYRMEDTTGFRAIETKLDNDSFRFDAVDTVEDGLFREFVRWETKTDHIPADNFGAVMDELSRARELSFTNFTYRQPSVSSAADTQEPNWVLAGVLSLLLLAGLGGLAVWSRRSVA